MSDIQLHTGNKTALLVGSTGLTGKNCQQFLLSHRAYKKVITFGRRDVEPQSDKHVHHVINFNSLDQYRNLFHGDDLFLCLGTTMEKAGSKEAFYNVDFEMNHQIAAICSDNDVKQLLLVSAVGSNPDSLFFYNRVKGELEEAVKKLNYWAIHIFQPSIILGDRSEHRTLESIAQRVARGANRIFGSWLTSYQPVKAEDLANAMIQKAQSLKSGIYTYSSDEINKINET